MYRIAIVTTDIKRDWASQRLLAAIRTRASGDTVDPISFGMKIQGKLDIRSKGISAGTYDAFIVRAFNRQGEIDYQYEIFQIMEQQGKLVINSMAGLSMAESKAQTSYCLGLAGLPVPRTIVTQDIKEALDALKRFGQAVTKPLYGSFGVGIEKVDHKNGEELLRNSLNKDGLIYLQEYIPNQGRDIRAFVVGDKIPAAMYRIAHKGQWKTNVFQGSSCQPCRLSPALKELCMEAVRVVGLEYTGIDIIEGPNGPVILELNGAPAWHGLESTTNRDISEDIIEHVIHMLKTGRPARQPAKLPLKEPARDR